MISRLMLRNIALFVFRSNLKIRKKRTLRFLEMEDEEEEFIKRGFSDFYLHP